MSSRGAAITSKTKTSNAKTSNTKTSNPYFMLKMTKD